MKSRITSALLVAVSCYASVALGARIDVESRLSGDNYVHSIYLNELTAADQAYGMSVSLLPGQGQFLNYDSDGRTSTGAFFESFMDASSDFTFTNALLSLPTQFPVPGEGWFVLDGSDEVPPPSGPNGIGYAVAEPGSPLEADGLLLNNLMLPDTESASVQILLIGPDGNLIPDGRLETIIDPLAPPTLISSLPNGTVIDLSNEAENGPSFRFDAITLRGEGIIPLTILDLSIEGEDAYLFNAYNLGLSINLQLVDIFWAFPHREYNANLSVVTNGGNLSYPLYIFFIPEPTTVTLCGIALLGLPTVRRIG